MSATAVSVWSPEPGLLSEGARWHEQRQELLWVDILGRLLHRATLTREGHPGRIETVQLDRDPQWDRLEPRRRHHVPQRQRHRLRVRV